MFIFLVGLLVLSYPIISRIYYRIEANEQIKDFDNEKKNLSNEEVDRRMKLARAFNDSLINNVNHDPYDEKLKREGRQEYARMLEIHERMGHVEIPKTDTDIPIYAGTTETVLQIGAGHLEGTSLPVGGNSTHTVITAHSGLPTARLFSDLKSLEIGDKFYIHNIKETLAYQVDQIKVIDPSNFSDLLISPGHDYATLLTCTPIMINTHRLLVRGHRVPYVPAIEEKVIAEQAASHMYRYLFYGSLLLIFILIILIFLLRKKKKQAEKKLKSLNENIEKLENSNEVVSNEESE
ncbi:class C sortase [Helcococcus bovis]|uniref:class C sortase n=1 Tax=Helcococcus bovis TaxID=3153252 RepID=UPI0038B6B990